MRVNLDACIHCNLCVRACREVQVNDVIGMAYRGVGSKIVFDFDDPMGETMTIPSPKATAFSTSIASSFNWPALTSSEPNGSSMSCSLNLSNRGQSSVASN